MTFINSYICDFKITIIVLQSLPFITWSIFCILSHNIYPTGYQQGQIWDVLCDFKILLVFYLCGRYTNQVVKGSDYENIFFLNTSQWSYSKGKTTKWNHWSQNKTIQTI